MNRFIKSKELCSNNSSIMTKKLFVPQRFDFHRKSSSGEWKQSFLLPVLGTVSKSCAKKAVIRVAVLVAAFFAFFEVQTSFWS